MYPNPKSICTLFRKRPVIPSVPFVRRCKYIIAASKDVAKQHPTAILSGGQDSLVRGLSVLGKRKIYLRSLLPAIKNPCSICVSCSQVWLLYSKAKDALTKTRYLISYKMIHVKKKSSLEIKYAM